MLVKPSQPAQANRRSNKRPEVREKDIEGLKFFAKLRPLLDRLHDAGCARDRANNRTLHMDQYVMLVLLYLFNPTLTSLRGIQQASQLKKVQKKLGCARASLGSLSESVRVFDPELLEGVVAELGKQLEPIARDGRLEASQGLSPVTRDPEHECQERAASVVVDMDVAVTLVFVSLLIYVADRRRSSNRLPAVKNARLAGSGTKVKLSKDETEFLSALTVCENLIEIMLFAMLGKTVP